ncbi:MAG: Crp/Fnr family transcriptional regulator [Clostridiales bacterium]|nr:Crp/Fnr family transcriptional regulator [Clostridiales bacterium]
MQQQRFHDEALERFPFLGNMTDASRKDFRENAQFLEIPAYSNMIEEGTQCRGVVMVLRGVIRVYQLREDGREMTLYRVGPGQLCVLTVACMMGAVDYPVIAEVEDEDAHVILLTQVLFRRLFNSDPEWQRYIFGAMADRLMEIMVILGEVVFGRMDERLAAWILRQSGNPIAATHEKIAADIGTAREVVSRVLKDMERRDMIALSRGRITVTSERRLRRLVGE